MITDRNGEVNFPVMHSGFCIPSLHSACIDGCPTNLFFSFLFFLLQEVMLYKSHYCSQAVEDNALQSKYMF